jgi:peptidoglycan DL-endopeptidase CwlO
MRHALALLAIVFTLAACASQAGPIPTADLSTPIPYLSTTTPVQTSTLIPTLGVAILPTPTTYTYTVVPGDTMSSIAAHAGVTLQALLEANPTVSPTALTVGMVLVIPTGASLPGEATPTPAQLPIKQAHCWPEATGGLWCFALVENNYAETLENISAQFTLLDTDGQQLTSQVAFGYLDILPPGADLPLAVHFNPLEQAGAGVRVQVLTAIQLLPGDTRYLPVSLENTLVSVDASGQTADVSGQAVLTGAGTAKTLWVLASAFDASGDVVGVRRWESPSNLTASNPVSFDFQISSLGPGIARVEFLAEARP